MVSADARVKRATTFVGDDGGKWAKCEALIAQMDVNGELNCAGDVCVINCMAGFVVDGGSPQAKCIKGMVHQSPSSRCTACSVFARNELFDLFGVWWTLIKGANDQWSFNKNLGFCVPTFNPEDPEPDVSGDDGKWERCEPLPIDNGKISCIGAKCTLFCNEGFMVEGRVNRNGKSRTDCRSINPER